jgi:hypothetical protein
MGGLFNFKYPKTFLLVLCIISAYYLFSSPLVSDKISNLGTLGYFGSFISGLLFSFGFTAPFAIGYFLQLNPSNIFLNCIIGGAGAVISDLLIFSIIRFSFMDEFKRIKKTKPIRYVNRLLELSFGHKIRNYLLYIFAGLVIASPLPDELGVTMLAGLSRIKPIYLSILSFILNSSGILIILLI